MNKDDLIRSVNFNTYVENIPDLLPVPPNSPNTNKWVKRDSFEIFGLNTPSGTQQEIKVELAKSNNWKEGKTVWEQVCRFGICTDLPVAYKRTCSKRFNLILKHPSLHSVKQEIEDCLKTSTAVAIAILVGTGNIPLATTTLKTSFVSCLKLKGVQFAEDIYIKIAEEKNCTGWTHVS